MSSMRFLFYAILLSLLRKFSIMEAKRSQIVSLYFTESSKSEILKKLKGDNITQLLIKRYKDVGIVVDKHRSGRPVSAHTRLLLESLRSRISLNPSRSMRKWPEVRSKSRKVMCEDLGLDSKVPQTPLRSLSHSCSSTKET